MHPFHPWFGRRFVAATRKQNWGEDRVMFFDDEEHLRSRLASWTDLVHADVWRWRQGVPAVMSAALRRF